MKKENKRKRSKPYRKCIELEFDTLSEKQEFSDRLNTFKAQHGFKKKPNKEILDFLLQCANKCDTVTSQDEISNTEQAAGKSFENVNTSMEKNGYHSICPQTSQRCDIFLTCMESINILIKNVYEVGCTERGSIGGCPLVVDSSRRGHAMKLSIGTTTHDGEIQNMFNWKSSPYLGKEYYVNYRYLAF